jgi:hypothetical protein
VKASVAVTIGETKLATEPTHEFYFINCTRLLEHGGEYKNFPLNLFVKES